MECTTKYNALREQFGCVLPNKWIHKQRFCIEIKIIVYSGFFIKQVLPILSSNQVVTIAILKYIK